MIRRRVRADDKNHLRVFDIADLVRNRARANAFEQCHHAGGMTQSCAVVDVVRAKAGTHQLLEQVRFFVGAFRAAKARQRFRPAAVFHTPVTNLGERTASQVERLFPCGFTKYVAPVFRVHPEVTVLRHTGLANQRHRETLLMVRVVKTKAPFHTQPRLIGRAIAPFDHDDCVVFDVIRELTTDAAIRADAIDFLVRHDGIRLFGRGQCASRARLHTLATRHTRRHPHRVVEVKHDLRFRPAKRVADDVVVLFFAASANAARALDAGVEVHAHRRMRKIWCGGGMLCDFRGEARFRHAKFVCPLGEFVCLRFVVFDRCVGSQ